MHHVTPRSQGGRNNPYNLVCLCRTCHMMLHRELDFVPPQWRKFGWEPGDIYEWRETMEQRLIEYVCDFYAEDIECGLYNPVDHDSFTIYNSGKSKPLGNTSPVRWDDLNDAQKRLIGQYWDKDKHRWVTVLSED